MKNVFKTKVIWAQMDPNRHLRHSAYADLAAQARIELLESIHLDMEAFARLKMGPILFREELIYLREITGAQEIQITTELTKSRKDGSRWSIRHEIFRADGTKSAIINVDGAWIDMVQRKLTSLPETLATEFHGIPKSADYILEEPKI